jgi:hypothetical protein
MKPVEYSLLRKADRVYWQVNSQPEGWRKTRNHKAPLIWSCEETGYQILSDGQIEIGPRYLYLRGVGMPRTSVSFWSFDSVEEAEVAIALYRRTMVLFNEYLATLPNPFGPEDSYFK